MSRAACAHVLCMAGKAAGINQPGDNGPVLVNKYQEGRLSSQAGESQLSGIPWPRPMRRGPEPARGAIFHTLKRGLRFCLQGTLQEVWAG